MRSGIRLVVGLAFIVLLGCAGGDYTDGVYEATGRGYHGDVQVQVTVTRGKVDTIEVIESEETAAMLEAVEEVLIPSIIEGQSIQGVDTVTGATRTSEAVLHAVEAVLEDAKPRT